MCVIAQIIVAFERRHSKFKFSISTILAHYNMYYNGGLLDMGPIVKVTRRLTLFRLIKFQFLPSLRL